MTMPAVAMSQRIKNLLDTAKQLSSKERVILAKFILDSVLLDEIEEDADWQNMSLAAFQKDWDNPDDAIYDNWREIYGISER